MATINQIKMEKTYQIKVNGKPNTWCKIVSKTDKRVYVYMYEGNAFIKDADGNPKKFLKDPKTILINKVRKTSTGRKNIKATEVTEVVA